MESAGCFYTIQTASTSPCRTQVQPAASFLVCSLIFIEYYLNGYLISVFNHIVFQRS